MPEQAVICMSKHASRASLWKAWKIICAMYNAGLSTPVAETCRPKLLLGGSLQLLQCWKCVQGGCILATLTACRLCGRVCVQMTGGESGAVGAAQAGDHAVDTGDVVVGRAHKLEQALERVLAQHTRPCTRMLQASALPRDTEHQLRISHS